LTPPKQKEVERENQQEENQEEENQQEENHQGENQQEENQQGENQEEENQQEENQEEEKETSKYIKLHKKGYIYYPNMLLNWELCKTWVKNKCYHFQGISVFLLT